MSNQFRLIPTAFVIERDPDEPQYYNVMDIYQPARNVRADWRVAYGLARQSAKAIGGEVMIRAIQDEAHG